MNNTIREKIEEIILGLALRAMALGARDEDTKAYYIQPQVDKLVSLFSQEVEEIIEEIQAEGIKIVGKKCAKTDIFYDIMAKKLKSLKQGKEV